MALSKKTKLLAKIEASYGVNPTPVGGSNAIQVYDINVQPVESDNVQSPAQQGFLGNSTRSTLLANKRVNVTFSAELAGSGTRGTASALSPLLKSCGMSEAVVSGGSGSVTYAPVSASFSSCTILCFYEATRHLITGCRGTFSISMNAGEPAVINFEFTGIYNAPDSTAMSGSFTVANQAAALEVSSTNITTATFHGATSQRIESFELALNNEYPYKETASSKEVNIVNRAPGGTAVIEEPVRSTLDYFAKAVGTATGNTSIVLGASSGNIITVNVPQTDITGISRGETNGINNISLPYLALPTTSGNNELSLVMT
tara:strand:- start:546 stop:1493 length:948 start_codon:yes stop_codon:yes gene_type:complete